MQDLLKYTRELQRQLQMLHTGNLPHRLANIQQIVNALENEMLDQSSQTLRELTKDKRAHLN